MTYERLWERLLESLNGWARAAEVEPGRIEVALDEPGRAGPTVQVVMTRDEWDDMVTVPWGDFDAAAAEVRKALLGLDDERFLVYSHYQLVASATPELPVDPEEERLHELARQHPEGFGRWVALDADGHVVGDLGPPD